MSGFDANGRIDKALLLLTQVLAAVRREAHARGLSRQLAAEPVGGLRHGHVEAARRLFAPKTMIDNWQTCFRDTFKPKTRTDVSKALCRPQRHLARQRISQPMPSATSAQSEASPRQYRAKSAAGVKPLIDDQIKAMAEAMGVAPEIAVKTIAAPPSNARPRR